MPGRRRRSTGPRTLRSEFDAWLASRAVEAGAGLVTSTTAVGLLRDARGAVVGVRTDRPDGDLAAKVVIGVRRSELVFGQGGRALRQLLE